MTVGAMDSAQKSIETMNISYLNDPSNVVSMTVHFRSFHLA
jgi:hypothetical protein